MQYSYMRMINTLIFLYVVEMSGLGPGKIDPDLTKKVPKETQPESRSSSFHFQLLILSLSKET
jgi:hypothetical protein